jgi:hypothetical protein
MAERGEPVKREKKGCEREAVNTLRFPDFVHADLDAELPVDLCEEHTKEVQKFPKTTEGAAVKKWLETD